MSSKSNNGNRRLVRPTETARNDRARNLADAIVEDLFTDGANGVVASSLELRKDGEYISGWSKFGMRNRIQKHLLGKV